MSSGGDSGNLQETLDSIRLEALEAIQEAEDSEELEKARVRFLGRNGLLSRALSGLRNVAPEERPSAGKKANEVKQTLETTLELRVDELAALTEPEKGPGADLTLPGRQQWRGGVHPVTRVIDEICEIFKELGFTRAAGPEVETDWHNFTALNIPLDHPAADMHDTFYLDDGVLLRTHTSPVQARVMMEYEPPVRILAPGMVFRRDPYDASHAPAFEQVEGLAVDEGIDFIEFRAAIDYFVHRFFGPATRTRFRPSYFPFTEPSAEVDVSCIICEGSGCAVCKRTGWIESFEFGWFVATYVL